MVYQTEAKKERRNEILGDLHNLGRVPMNGVVVEIGCRVEPEVELLLPASISLCVDVCVYDVRLSRDVPQELEIDLIVSVARRGHLHKIESFINLKCLYICKCIYA